MFLYNTSTRKKEKFTPWSDDSVKMYTCGPTVYHYAHIGNLRTYIMEDILEKALEYQGYNVKRVMNVTDVGHLTSDADTGDDKMVTSAKKENKTVLDIADYYTNAFFSDIDKLNIRRPEIISKATDNIPGYIKFISILLEKKFAYESDGNIYFDTSKLDNYYSLTNHVEEEMISGARESVEEDLSKKNKTDFALWFTKSKFDDQELKWDSPFGTGYPGWHIECSCISDRFLGEYIDIHCGGIDNIFPHHTNEIAQSEAVYGHKWCNYWVHAEHLNDESGKMSKSKGKTLTVNSIEEEGYKALSYRFMCLMSHYRNQLTFTYDSLKGAETAYNKLKNKIVNLDLSSDFIDEKVFNDFDDKFKSCISDDLNTASAITLIYDILKYETNDFTKYEVIRKWDTVLSLNLCEHDIKVDEEYINEMINKRNEAKENKDYALADSIRDELIAKNIILKDTKEGTKYEVII